MSEVKASCLGQGVLIVGDSELIIGFCNRKYRPSKKIFSQILKIKRAVQQFKCPVNFRHVYRENNRLADWMCNIAK